MFTLQFFHENFSRDKTFAEPICSFMHVFQGIKHKKTIQQKKKVEIFGLVIEKKLIRTLLVDVFDQYEYLMVEFRFLKNAMHPLIDHLQLIRNIFVRELNISFARRRK